jgi:Vacuolar membrane-associated protein Iml1
MQSSEMWDYASPYERNRDESKCETYFDKWISFVRRLFDKWKEFEVTHSLTVVFFSRTFIGESPPIWYAASQRKNASPTKDHDIYGRHFEDHFRIVIENETSSDWDSLVVRLKEAFVRYPCEVEWNLASGADARRPSSASQGNVMEAINVTLNLLAFHYLDRDLHRTGNSIVIISAGNGVFEVDKGLAAITYERMMVNGIGSDMLSLALPPLHTAPFFLYVNDQSSGGSLDFGGTYYEVPHWMHLSFVNYDSEERFVAVDVAHQPKRAPPCVLEIDGRPVLANGFLLPRVLDPRHIDTGGNSPLIRPAGAAPASPVKQSKIVSQERQLIAGRDFNDILEACRPRNSTGLPSALRSLLRIFHVPEPLSSGHRDDRLDTTDDLPEWGSIDHESTTDSPSRQSHHRRVVALGQEPGVDLSPGFGPLPAPGGSFDGDQAEKESVASSYASQHSSGIGVAYDRPFVNNKSSPTLAGVQVQKSASLDFFFHDNEDAGSESETNSATSNSNSSSSVSARRADRQVKRDQKLVARLKKEMRQHDEKLLAVEAPKASKAPEDSKHSAVNFGGSTQASHAGSRSGKQSGGIGAALSQYRTTSSGSSIPEYFEGPSSVSRVASTTKLTSMSHSKMTIPEMGSRGMSPLVLPPITLSSSEIPTSTVRRLPLEQRLVHRTDYSRSGFESSSRVTGKTTSSSLSRSPPIASSPNLAMSMMSSSSALRRRPATSRSSIYQSKLRKSRQKKAFNPFRQEDEEEVLAKKSHNRRRWSHVFPLGEVEFKRHAGPNWKSLSSPAILPLFVD